MEQISWNEILYSVNASVVGLARCASEEVRIRGPDPVFIFLEMPYKSFQYTHGHFEDYAIWYHMYFNTYHSKLGLHMTYLTFLCDETLFLLLQCRFSRFEQLGRSAKCFKKCNDYCILGGHFHLRWTRTSSLGVKKFPVFSSYRCQDDLLLDTRLDLNSNFTYLYLYEA